MSGGVIALATAVVASLLWLTLTLLRRAQLAHAGEVAERARVGLREFADVSLTLGSLEEILSCAADAARIILGCDSVVAFENRAAGATWGASDPGRGKLGEVPRPLHGVFGWFRHNGGVAIAAELEEPRFGAMRGPLRQLMERYEVDILVPFVREHRVLAVLGLALPRRPTAGEREFLHLFRLRVGAACANVCLHVEVAHMLSLAKEVDLAGSVCLQLVPPRMEGTMGRVHWAGYHRAAAQSGRVFWQVYPAGEDRVIVLIGDAVGSGLAGTLISAVVKSSADAIVEAESPDVTPGTLLNTLNRSL